MEKTRENKLVSEDPGPIQSLEMDSGEAETAMAGNDLLSGENRVEGKGYKIW